MVVVLIATMQTPWPGVVSGQSDLSSLPALPPDAPGAAFLSAINEAGQVTRGLANWTAESFTEVVAIAGRHNTALADIIPSVQGCLRWGAGNQRGQPVSGHPVAGIPIAVSAGTPPLIAVTSSRNANAQLYFPGSVIPVAVKLSWLSEQQRAAWGSGCYWMPLPPGPLGVLGAIATGNQAASIRVAPVSPDARFSSAPGARDVLLATDASGAEARIIDYAIMPPGPGIAPGRLQEISAD